MYTHTQARVRVYCTCTYMEHVASAKKGNRMSLDWLEYSLHVRTHSFACTCVYMHMSVCTHMTSMWSWVMHGGSTSTYVRVCVHMHVSDYGMYEQCMYTHNMLTTNTSNMDVGTENRSKVKLVSFLHFHGTPCLPACLPACIVPLRSWRAKNRTITETFQDNNRNIYALLGQLRFISAAWSKKFREQISCGETTKESGLSQPFQDDWQLCALHVCTFLMLREA